MTKQLLTLTAFCVLLLASGCVSRYVVVLNSGSSTTSKGKPKIKTKYETRVDANGKKHKVPVTRYYEFTDIGGQLQRYPLSRISQIYPLSDQGDSDLYYLPTSYDMPKKKTPWYSSD
jgi:hypothetical protein